MKVLLGKGVFQEQLLKRDFKGDTPIHIAAKSGSIEILDFFMTAVTPAFMELENDFGLTPLSLVSEKLDMLKERLVQDVPESYSPDIVEEMRQKASEKISKMKQILGYLKEFDNYIDVDKWQKRFEIPLPVFLEVCVDPNLQRFMGFPMNTDIVEDQQDLSQIKNSSNKKKEIEL